MTIRNDATPRPLATGRGLWPWLWWLLPLAEAAALSLRLDTGSLQGTEGWWAQIAANGGAIASIALISAAAGAVIVWARAVGGKRPSFAQIAAPRPGRTVWPAVTGHFVALLLFAALCDQVFGAGEIKPTTNSLLAAAWAASGIVAAGLWALSALPVSAWIALARRWWPEALAALAIGLAAWSAGAFTDRLWVQLCGPTFYLVRGMLGPLGSPSVCDPASFTIGTETFRVAIAESCSGYQGIGLIWVAMSAYLWLFRRRLKFPQALLLLPIGTVLIWLANAARIALLVVVGTYLSRDVALGGFHSQVGWLMFIAVALGLMAGAQKVRLFSHQAGRVAAAKAGNPTARYLLPLMVMILAKMFTSAFSAGFDRLYVLGVAATAGALLAWWPKVARALRSRDFWSAPAVGIGAAAFGIWLVCERLMPPASSGSGIAAGLAKMPAGWAAAWLVARVVGAVVTVPLAEELAFRGCLMRRLASADFVRVPYRSASLLAVVLSSVLFGALHGRYVAGTLAGLLFAYACWRRGRLADAVIAHSAANAMLAVYVLTTGSYTLW